MSNLDISISVSWQGRLRRKTFWCTFLMFSAIGLVGGVLLEGSEGACAVLSLVLLPFELSLIVRRAQDAGLDDKFKHLLVGAYALISILSMVLDDEFFEDNMAVALFFLVYLGVFIVVLSKDSVPGSNKWGPNPKAADAAGVQARSGGAPKQVCPTCSGSGKNAVGHVCPRCGGRGVLS